MRTLVPAVALAVTLAGRMAAPAEARAQWVPPRPMSDTISVGVTFGAGRGAPLDGGVELGGSVELPLGIDFRARGDLGVGLWQYEAPEYSGRTSATFGRHRVTGSLIRSVVPVGPGRLGFYTGGGAGLYVTTIAGQGASWGRGGHILWGLEHLTESRRWLISGEIQLQLVDEPRLTGDRTREPGLGAHFAIAVRRRLQ
jgi:hypothetical protein